MSAQRIVDYFTRAYLGIFFLYLFLPLIVMSVATFNSSRFPTVTPWQETTLKWFGALAADGQMWDSLWTSLAVGVGVIVVAVPIGVAAALFLTDLQTRAKTFIYGVMVSPLLTPGVIIGISTLIFWQSFGVTGGFMLMVLSQSTFIAAYVMGSGPRSRRHPFAGLPPCHAAFPATVDFSRLSDRLPAVVRELQHDHLRARL